MVELDRRLHAYRPDLADIKLRGRVEAARFVRGERQQVIAPLVDLYPAHGRVDRLTSQLLMGDMVEVFEVKNGFAFIQSLKDGYVGYVRTAMLGRDEAPPSHYVRARSTFLYPQPDLKEAPVQLLSLGAKVIIVDCVETRGLLYAVTPSGTALVAAHLRSVDERPDDYVRVAEELQQTPYLWGGASALGIDCSGLVQLSLGICGIDVPRDSDMQETSIGRALDTQREGGVTDGLQRGDLVFWPGHVAIMQDETRAIHANGTSMDVRSEPLHQIIARMGQPAHYRRPDHFL